MRARRARHRRGTVVIAFAIAGVAVLLPALALRAHRARLLLAEPGARHVRQAGGRWIGPGHPQDLQRPRQEEARQDAGRLRDRCRARSCKKHGTNKQLSKNKSIKALNKDLKKARKKGYKLRESQPPIKTQEEEGQEAPRRSTSSCCGSASTPRSRPRSPPPTTTTASRSCRGSTRSRSRGRKPTNDPTCAQYKITNDKNQAGAVSYAYQCHCPNDQNLIAVLGRSLTSTPVPQPPLLDRHNIPDAGPCIRCNLQIQGTGASPDAVTIDAGNTASGDGAPIGAVKDVGIRADRADGFVVDNLKVRHAKEHDIYVIETDGSHLNRFKVPYAGEYGLLTFVADHSLIENCDGWGAGDSALYPGASADLGEAVPPNQRRYGTELRNCDMHHSALGYSGTDGNAVWVHNNDFYDNTMGFSTDVFTAPGHPGFPQDSDLVENNNFYDNNFNTYLPPCAPGQKPGPAARVSRRQPGGNCSDVEPDGAGAGRDWALDRRRQRQRHPQQPLLRQLAARHDALRRARRSSSAATRTTRWPGCDPAATVPATSYRNRFYDNKMGQAPDGSAQPNGVDFWWDQGGVSSARTTPATAGTTTPARTAPRQRDRHALPTAPPTSRPTAITAHRRATRSGRRATGCVTSPQGRPGCPWFTTPPKP